MYQTLCNAKIVINWVTPKNIAKTMLYAKFVLLPATIPHHALKFNALTATLLTELTTKSAHKYREEKRS